ncbi:hypothetical protein CapIbe_006741 [Capra ibex]
MTAAAMSSAAEASGPPSVTAAAMSSAAHSPDSVFPEFLNPGVRPRARPGGSPTGVLGGGQVLPPPAVADMEPVASNIQVLLQAAEFLERREREAEHGYASLCPHRSPGPVHRRRKRSPQAPGALDSGRSVHNELEKRRRAQLKRCLEQLKQQMPLGADCVRYTTLSLLRRARMHIQKLEEQELRARQLKEKLRSKQRSLRQQLEQLRGLGTVGERERLRADSLDSSGLSSERSDSDQEELEVDVESLVFGGEAELLRGFSAGQEHSYSHSGGAWL